MTICSLAYKEGEDFKEDFYAFTLNGERKCMRLINKESKLKFKEIEDIDRTRGIFTEIANSLLKAWSDKE